MGATYPQQLTELRKQLPHTFFLVPGYGAQGGAAADACRALDENGIHQDKDALIIFFADLQQRGDPVCAQVAVYGEGGAGLRSPGGSRSRRLPGP